MRTWNNYAGTWQRSSMSITTNNERSAAAGNAGISLPTTPHPEAVARAKRRRFTADYKRSILEQAHQATQSGDIGALLRRQGLFSSHLITWRRERKAGVLQALTPRKRGPQCKRNPLADENQKLQRDNQRLAEQLRKAEIIIDVQKKWRPCWAPHPRSRPGGQALSTAMVELTPIVGTQAACNALGLVRSSFYRQRRKPAGAVLVTLLPGSPRPTPARALSSQERAT